MENTILTIALSSIDFLNFFEKTRLLKELKAMENAGHFSRSLFSTAEVFGLSGSSRPIKAITIRKAKKVVMIISLALIRSRIFRYSAEVV